MTRSWTSRSRSTTRRTTSSRKTAARTRPRISQPSCGIHRGKRPTGSRSTTTAPRPTRARSRSSSPGHRLRCNVLDAHPKPLRTGVGLEEAGRGHVNAGAGVLDEQDSEAFAAKIAGGEEAADVRGDAADDHRADAAGPVQGEQAGVLGGHRVRLEIALVALAPDRVEALRL